MRIVGRLSIEGLDFDVQGQKGRLGKFEVQFDQNMTPEEFTSWVDSQFKMVMQVIGREKKSEKVDICSDCAVARGGKCEKHLNQ